MTLLDITCFVQLDGPLARWTLNRMPVLIPEMFVLTTQPLCTTRYTISNNRQYPQTASLFITTTSSALSAGWQLWVGTKFCVPGTKICVGMPICVGVRLA